MLMSVVRLTRLLLVLLTITFEASEDGTNTTSLFTSLVRGLGVVQSHDLEQLFTHVVSEEH